MSTDAPLLVFDGVCVLCCRSVQFVLRHDRKKIFRFAVTQSDIGRATMNAHGLDPSQPASVLLVDNGRAFVESAALVRVMKRFGGAWRLVAAMLWIVPKPLRDTAYRFVAKRRYRWFGQNETCYLPDDAERVRFLEK